MKIIVTPARLVREADGAQCPECGTVFGKYWREGMVPWGWRQSQRMHEQGTGHKMQLFKVIPASTTVAPTWREA